MISWTASKRWCSDNPAGRDAARIVAVRLVDRARRSLTWDRGKEMADGSS
jgi:IS30 family transposase